MKRHRKIRKFEHDAPKRDAPPENIEEKRKNRPEKPPVGLYRFARKPHCAFGRNTVRIPDFKPHPSRTAIVASKIPARLLHLLKKGRMKPSHIDFVLFEGAVQGKPGYFLKREYGGRIDAIGNGKEPPGRPAKDVGEQS